MTKDTVSPPNRPARGVAALILAACIAVATASCATKPMGPLDFRDDDARELFERVFGEPESMRYLVGYEGVYLPTSGVLTISRTYRLRSADRSKSGASVHNLLAVSAQPSGEWQEIARATVISGLGIAPHSAFRQELYWNGRLEGPASESPIEPWAEHFPRGDSRSTAWTPTESCEYALVVHRGVELIHFPSGSRWSVAHLDPDGVEALGVFDADDDGVLLLVDADGFIRIQHLAPDGSLRGSTEIRSPRLSRWYYRWFERFDDARIVAGERGDLPIFATRYWMIDRGTGKRTRLGSPDYKSVIHGMFTEEERHAILASLRAMDGSTPPSEPLDLRLLVEWKGFDHED